MPVPQHPGSPVLPRKRLGNALRSLRERNGYTLDHVASRLLVSVSKLSRLEKAQGLPQLRDVRDLVSFYELDETEGERLMRWAREGRRKGWWTSYDDVLQPEEHAFIGYENEATTTLQYAIPIVPGLLQTESYCREVISHWNPQFSESELGRRVQIRLTRQQNLTSRELARPLELRAVLHESCLMQSVGSADALREQLETLVTFSKLDNVDIRILLMSADPHTAIASMFQHFSFGDEIDRDIVFIESATGIQYVEDELMVRRFERWHTELERRSLDPAMSVARINDALAAL